MQQRAVGMLFNGIIPALLLLGLAQGRFRGLVSSAAALCGSRWLFLSMSLAFGVASALAATLLMWYYPRPELLFGPGVRENLKFGSVFLSRLMGYSVWPGPLVAIAVWLLPRGRAALKGPGRELLMCFCAGCLVLSFYYGCAGAAFSLTPSWMQYLLPESLRFKFPSYYFYGLASGVFLCVLAALVARGRFSRAADQLSRFLRTPSRILGAGLLLIALLCSLRFVAIGKFPSWTSIAGLFVLEQLFWPVVQVSLLVWLTRLRIQTYMVPVFSKQAQHGRI